MRTSPSPPLRACRVSEDSDNNKALGHARKQIEVRMKQHMRLRTLSQMKAYRHAVGVTTTDSYIRADDWLPFANGQNKVTLAAEKYSCTDSPN